MDQMNQGTLIIGLGREGKEILRQLKDRSPGDRLESWITFSGPGEDRIPTGAEEGETGGREEFSHLRISSREPQEIREEVQGFIRALDDHRLRALERMEQIEAALEDETVSFQVARARHAGAFYVGEAELPKLLEALCHHLHHGPEPRWSLHYRRVEELLHRLEEFALARFLRLEDWSIEEVLLKLGNCPEAFSKMNAYCQPLAQMKDFPSSPLTTMLYLGVEDEQRTRLRSQDALGVIQGGHQFYTTGQGYMISGLRLAHGFPLFALGGILDLQQGYQRMREQGSEEVRKSGSQEVRKDEEEKEALEGYEPFEDLIPEEMEK